MDGLGAIAAVRRVEGVLSAIRDLQDDLTSGAIGVDDFQCGMAMLAELNPDILELRDALDDPNAQQSAIESKLSAMLVHLGSRALSS